MYYLSVFIHIIAAMFWIGGMLFTVFVLVPASRHKLLAAKKGEFFTLIGRIFSRITWLLFLLLLITGITNLLARGYALVDLSDPAFWNSSFGGDLFVKLMLFSGVLLLSGIHDFYAGPKAAELMDKHPRKKKTETLRCYSRWIGRLNLVLGLAILYYAMKLLRG